ncbi:MAG: lytic murein transglycosylase [Alphaproteobacteria bacterium]
MSLPLRRSALAVALSGLMLTIAIAVPGPASATPPQPALRNQAPKPEEVIPQGFETWRDGFIRKAPANGVRRDLVEEALRGVTPDPKVLKRNAYQPEFTRPIWDYLDGAVSDLRVKNGRKRLDQHRALLGRVERAYGVPAPVIVAIWGLETSYGAIKGDFDIVRSLATLAYAGRRSAFGERELINALKIIQSGDKTRAGLKGSWAGAMGHTQFLPSSFLSYAVDFDGDGRRDIWDSLPDAFASTANFLKKANWDSDYRWGREVALPDRFDYGLAGLSVRKDLDTWASLGVRRPGGSALPLADLKASILVPAGHTGPAFIVYQNFRAIMRYNPATAYALGIAHLSDRIKGAGAFSASWPRNTKILSRAEREDLQRLLNRAGYGVGDVDGVIGARTRAAVRAFQSAKGLPADGFATADLLAALRQAAR